jgi:hypothetical protein
MSNCPTTGHFFTVLFSLPERKPAMAQFYQQRPRPAGSPAPWREALLAGARLMYDRIGAARPAAARRVHERPEEARNEKSHE